MLLYANENHRAYPLRDHQLFRYVMKEEPSDASCFVCLSTNDTRTTGATTRELISSFDTGEHFSYVYLGRGFTLDAPATAVLIYEPLTNHGDHANVLFGDGHVETLLAHPAEMLIAELESGHNPPRAEKLRGP
jgi:prepilin-type processing-associated H-X9-DG protein